MLPHEKSSLWSTPHIQDNIEESLTKKKTTKKKSTQVYPVSSSTFQDTDRSRMKRTRSTGPGRIVSIVIDPLESPTPINKQRQRTFTFESKQPSQPESPRASDFSFGNIDEEFDDFQVELELDDQDGKTLHAMTTGKRAFHEHEPGYGQMGAKDVSFGGHRGWNRRQGDEHGFQVADDEWAEILNDVNAGIDDGDLDINDKIEQYLNDKNTSGGVKAGMDLPVAEINDLVRQFSTRNKGATFQEEGVDGDVVHLYDGQEHVAMTGMGRNKQLKGTRRKGGRRGRVSFNDRDRGEGDEEDEEEEEEEDYYSNGQDYNNQPRRRRRNNPQQNQQTNKTNGGSSNNGTAKGQNPSTVAAPGWSGPPPGTILVTQKQIIALKQNVNQAHQRRTKVLKKQLMANKKFIAQLSKKLGDTTEQLIELQVKAHLGYGGSGGGGGGGVGKLIESFDDDVGGGNNKKRSADELRRERVKRSLLAGLVEAADQFNTENIDVFAKNEQLRTGCRYYCYTTLRWCNNHLPLTHDVRSIEARYGQNVASFFHFLRYVIFCFALLSVFNLATYTWHISDIMYNGNNLALTISKSRELQGSCIWDESRNHTVCTIQYDEKATPRWDNSKDGWAWFDNLEHWKSVAALPSAFGFSQQDDENSYSSFVYAFNMVISTVVLAVMALVKLIREDRVFKIVHSTDGGESNDFPKLTFDAWDHGITIFSESWDRKSAVTQQLHTTLHRATIEAEIKGRSRWVRAKIWGKRGLGVFLSILVQAGGWYLLYNLIDRQNGAFKGFFTSAFFKDNPTTANLAVPLAISSLNAIIPTVIWMIVVKTEKWDDKKTEMKQITLRVFIAKVLNVVIAVISAALVWDPRMFKHTSYMGGRVNVDADAIKSGSTGALADSVSEEYEFSCVGSVESGFRNQLREKPLNECVMDTIASIFVQLLLVNFVFGKVTILLKTGLKYAIFLSKGSKGKWKAEFWVPFYVVNLVYSVTLNVVCIPFYPLTFVLGCVLLFLEFKFTKFRLENFMYKPLTPYSAKDVGLFFLKFYLLVVGFGILWVHFFLSHASFCQFLEFRAAKIVNTDQAFPTQSHNLYVRAIDVEETIGDDINQDTVDVGVDPHCIGFTETWSPALHAVVISDHSKNATSETCYDCETNGWDEYQKDEPVIQLAECTCTRTSTIWTAWRTNTSEPLKLMLLDNTSFSSSGEQHWGAQHLKPACGPFIGYRIGYEALTSKMNEYGKYTFNAVVTRPSALTVLSFVILGLIMKYLFRGNTMDASQMTDHHAQLKLSTEVEALRSRNNAIQQQLNLRRRQQAAMLKKE